MTKHKKAPHRNNFGSTSDNTAPTMTRPMPWPYQSKEARDRAAEAAIAGIRALQPIIGDLPITSEERLRRSAVAITKLHEIAFLLKEVGAPIEMP
jgi:hypothetical protein